MALIVNLLLLLKTNISPALTILSFTSNCPDNKYTAISSISSGNSKILLVLILISTKTPLEIFFKGDVLPNAEPKITFAIIFLDTIDGISFFFKL